MSLVAFALRIATVRAIRAAVWPEFIVADSPQVPLAILEEGRPLIAVYTGATNALETTELLAGDPKVSLLVQIFLPAEVTIAVAGQPITIDTRREGAETVLDVVARRILAAFPTQAEPWARLWGQLVFKVERVANASYLVETTEVRTSARELTLECAVLDEPVPGAPPEGVWAELIALMRGDGAEGADGYPPGSVAPLADWLAAEIAGPMGLSQDERDRIDLGLSAYAAREISVLPIVRGSEVGEVAVAIEGRAVEGLEGDTIVVPGPAVAPPAPAVPDATPLRPIP